VTKVESLISSKMNFDDNDKDLHYFSSLRIYLDDSIGISSLTFNTVISLKKVLSNLNMLILSFKGSLSTLIFVERSRILILEKLNYIKREIKSGYETRKETHHDSHRNRLDKLQEIKENIIKEKTKVDLEKEFLLRKVKNCAARPYIVIGNTKQS